MILENLDDTLLGQTQFTSAGSDFRLCYIDHVEIR